MLCCKVPVLITENIGAPKLGPAEGGHFFVPICSDFAVFFRFVPICVPCLREYPDLFRFAPICSDVFVFRANQNKSGKPLSADPFCKSPKISPHAFIVSPIAVYPIGNEVVTILIQKGPNANGVVLSKRRVSAF